MAAIQTGIAHSTKLICVISGRLSWWIMAVFLNQVWHRETLPRVINILGIKLRIGRKILCHSVALSCSWGNRPLWVNGVISEHYTSRTVQDYIIMAIVICMCSCSCCSGCPIFPQPLPVNLSYVSMKPRINDTSDSSHLSLLLYYLHISKVHHFENTTLSGRHL